MAIIEGGLPLNETGFVFSGNNVINAKRIMFPMFWDTTIKYNVQIYDAREIGNNCFRDYNFLNSVNIDSNIVLIDDHAFENCYNLQTINIPKNIQYIGWRAFHDCDKLELNLKSSLFYCPAEIEDSFLVKKIIIRNKEYKDLDYDKLAEIRVSELIALAEFICKMYKTNYSHTLDEDLISISLSLFLFVDDQKNFKEELRKNYDARPIWKDKFINILYKYLRKKKKISYFELDINSKTKIEQYITDFYNIKEDKKKNVVIKENPLQNMTANEVYQRLENISIKNFNLDGASSILEFGSDLDYYFGYAANIISEIISMQNNDDKKTNELLLSLESTIDIDTYNSIYNYVILKEESILKQINEIDNVNKILKCYICKVNICRNKLLEIKIDNESLRQILSGKISSLNTTLLAATNQVYLINNWLTINSNMKNKLNELKNTTLPLLIMNINKQNSDDEIIIIKEKIDKLISKLFYEELDKETRKIKKKKI